jgi:hypothetical protein
MDEVGSDPGVKSMRAGTSLVVFAQIPSMG